jgi:hypothetical protein
MSIITTLMMLIVACSATPTPDPHITPLPTRAQPEDISHQALSDALSEVEYDLTQARSMLVYLSKAPQLQTGAASECRAFLQQLLKTNLQYAQLGIASSDGSVYCDSGATARERNIKQTLAFNRVMNRRAFAVGDYMKASNMLPAAIDLAYPVLNGTNQLNSVVVAPLSLDWIADRFSAIEIPVTGEMLLMDTDGALLLRDPDSDQWVGKNISNSPLGQAMLTKLQGSGEFAGADGVARFYSFASPVSSNKNLIVAVGIPR